MERWNVGILGIENGERAHFGSGALRLRIIEFILRNGGQRQEAKNSWPSASSPPEVDTPSTSIRILPIHEPIIPVFHYSNMLAGVKQDLERSKKHFRAAKSNYGYEIPNEEERWPDTRPS